MPLEDRRQLTLEQRKRALHVEATLATYNIVGLHLAQQTLTALRTGQPVVTAPFHVLVQRFIVGDFVLDVFLMLVHYELMQMPHPCTEKGVLIV